MKKTIFGLALGLMAIALPAAAQKQTCVNNETAKATTECVSKEGCTKSKDCKDCDRKCHKKDQKMQKKGHKMQKKGHKMHQKGMNPMLRGIELTADQKTRMEKLHQEAKEARKKVAEKSSEEKAKIYKDYMEKMEKVLTTEQLAKYKENCKGLDGMKGKAPRNGNKHMNKCQGDKQGHHKSGAKDGACTDDCKTKENKK